MTEQEAIDLVHCCMHVGDERILEARGMAIESLKKQSIFEQIKWERDIAIEQLNEIGVGLGRKMDEVKEALEKQIPKKVVYKPEDAVYQRPYCPSCGEELFDANYTIGRCGCGQNLFYGG